MRGAHRPPIARDITAIYGALLYGSDGAVGSRYVCVRGVFVIIIMRAALFVGIWICGGGVDDVRHRARSMSVCV